MTRRDPSPASAYAIAVAAVAFTLLARLPLAPVLGNRVPFITLFPAVLLAAYLGGLWPGLAAAALGAAGAAYFLLEPTRDFRIAAPGDVLGVVLFAAVGVIISVICELLRRAGRRAADEAARAGASEDRLRAIIDNWPSALFVKDAAGRYLLANKACEPYTGEPHEKTVGKTDYDYLPAEVADRFRADDRRVLESGRGLRYEEAAPINGEVRHALTVKFPLADPAGRPHAVCGITTDITDLKRAEQALRERDEQSRFRAEVGEVLASSLDYQTTLAGVARLVVPRMADWCSVHVTDPDGRPRQLAVAHTDPAKVAWATELQAKYPPDPDAPVGVPAVIRTGRPELLADIPDDLLVRSARDPEHLAILRELGLKSAIVVPLAARGRTLGAITFVGAESGRRYGPADLEAALDLGRRAGLAVDNARLYRESQEALRLLGLLVEAAGRLPATLDPPAVRAAVLDLSHRLIAADAYAIWRQSPDLTEWSVADSAGLSAEYLRTAGRIVRSGATMPDRPIIAEDALATALLEERRAAYRAEGIASLLTVPLHIRGAVSGTLAFYYRERRKFDDLTVRVASALADLAGAALGTAELYQRESESRRRAEDADRAKDEFLALLGHELRNPLAPLRNASHLLTLKGDDPAVVGSARDMIGRQVGQMTRLVDELLDASRIARRKVVLSVGPVDLADLARTAAEDHRPEFEAAGLALAVDVPASPVRVTGDAARLTQTVENFLTNAKKFTDPGGRVVVRVGREGGTAVLAVSDTGIGFDPAAAALLFQPFHQAAADLARSKGGLGLGLSVVKGLVELHGGTVTAASGGPGKGATFTVRLPADDTARGVAPPAARVVPQRAGGRRVVVVEDGVDTAESLRLLLEMHGHAAEVAHTGPAGLELARRVRPDVVVCDIGLPGMTGYEVAAALRADPLTAGAVLVCLTGYGQEEDKRKARAAGFDVLLTKPADPAELLRVVGNGQARA